MAMTRQPLTQNALVDQNKLLMDQAVANAKGIAQLNTNIEQYHNDTIEGINAIQRQLEDIDNSLKLMNAKQDTHTELLTAKSDDIHTTTAFTQKVMIVFSSLITILLLVLCIMTWKNIQDTKAEGEKESIISRYQEILDEYGIEFPDFPEFPEMNLYGTGE